MIHQTYAALMTFKIHSDLRRILDSGRVTEDLEMTSEGRRPWRVQIPVGESRSCFDLHKNATHTRQVLYQCYGVRRSSQELPDDNTTLEQFLSAYNGYKRTCLPHQPTMYHIPSTHPPTCNGSDFTQLSSIQDTTIDTTHHHSNRKWCLGPSLGRHAVLA